MKQNQAPSPEIRILIVEDNEVNLKVIKAILDRGGFAYDTAMTGTEAVLKYDKSYFDLVFMDCQMPVMDGLEAAMRIRASENEKQSKRCPIVALTANAMKGDREKCLKAGMDDFLPKPFKSQELIAKIKNWVVNSTTLS